MPVSVLGKLEVEFVPGSGTWVDLTSRCNQVKVVRPRSGQGIAPTTTVLTAMLENFADGTGFCPLSPDNPAGAYYPNVVRDRRVRLTAVWNAGANTSVRFLGWADTWVPDAANGNTSNGTVTLTASCILSRYARTNLLSDYGQTFAQVITHNDYYPLDEPSDSVTVRGVAADLTPVAARVIQPTGGTGQMQLGKPDSTILVDGSAQFSRGDSQSPSPVLLIRLRDGENLTRTSAWFKLNNDPALANDDAIVMYDASGNSVWRLVVALVSGKIHWQVLDANNAITVDWNSGVPRDESWHWVSILPFVSGSNAIAIAIRDKSVPDRIVGTAFFTTADPRIGKWMVVGGRMPPFTLGKQTNTLMGDVSSIWLQYGSDFGASYSDRSTAGFVRTGAERNSLLDNYSSALDALVGGPAGGGPDATPVMFTGANTNLLQAWQEHIATVGGILSTQPNGKRRYAVPVDCRLPTVVLTLDASADLQMDAGGWTQVHDERPTRITGTGPVGSITVTDTVTEALTGIRLDGQDITTAGGTIDVPRNAAALVIARRRARLSSFGVDATLTATDKVATIMGLLAGDRIRVTGLPTAYLGISEIDQYASGWEETYSGKYSLAQFVFDSDPADDPPEGVWDDAEYGRTAMDSGSVVSGGTCVGTTTTGTVILTTTSPLITTGGEYSMDLDWNGERITISGVGGGTSPQTATVTARGVVPSVARVHASGETVDVYHAATLGL